MCRPRRRVLRSSLPVLGEASSGTKFEMDLVPNSAWEDIRRVVVPKERRQLWSVLLREKTQATRQLPLFFIDSIIRFVFHDSEGNKVPMTISSRSVT